MCSGDLYLYADCQRSSVASGCSVVLASGSTWRSHNADDGSHCAIVSQRSFSIFLGESKTSGLYIYIYIYIYIFFFFFFFFSFLEFLTFSRWFSSLKKRFKNHDGKTASPANHEME